MVQLGPGHTAPVPLSEIGRIQLRRPGGAKRLSHNLKRADAAEARSALGTGPQFILELACAQRLHTAPDQTGQCEEEPQDSQNKKCIEKRLK